MKQLFGLILVLLSLCEHGASLDSTAIDLDNINSEYARFNVEDLSELVFDTAYKHNLTSKLEVVLVVSSFGNPPDEDISWINEQPWPTFVSTKAPGFGYHSEPWGNVGWDIASFLNFIVTFWDVLPERMIFAHGHNMAWHQAGYKMSYMLRNLCVKDFEYVNLNTNPQNAKDWKGTASEAHSAVVRMINREIGQLSKLPEMYYDRCCQQWMVTREKVQLRPLEFWKELRGYMTDGERLAKNRIPGVFSQRNMATDLPFLEESWHHIFGVPKIVQRKYYGQQLDFNLETGEQLTNNIHQSLHKVVNCPTKLCQKSPTCSAEVAKENARGVANKLKGKLADGAGPGYWKVMRKKKLAAARLKKKLDPTAQVHDLGR